MTNVYRAGAGWVSQSSLEKLKAHFAKTQIALIEEMIDPPTITYGSANTTPISATTRIIPWNGVSPQVNTIFNSPYIRIFNSQKIIGSALGVTETTLNSQEKYLCATPKFPSANGGLGGYCMEFMFDGSNIEFLCFGPIEIAGTINGKSISRNYITSGVSSSTRWIKLSFGSRAIREFSLYVVGQIGCIAIGPNDSISPINTKSPSCVIHGDSFFTTTGEHIPFGGVGGEAALLSGIRNIWGTGWGGSSYYTSGNGGGGTTGNSLTAFTELVNVEECELWHCSLGINEDRDVIGPALYDATVLEYYTLVRSAFPNAIISTTGPWCPKESRAKSPRGYITANAILAQLEKIAGPWIFLDNTQGFWKNSNGKTGTQKVASTSSVTTVNGGPSVNTGAQTPSQFGSWQTGEGNVGALTGKGNGDIYVDAAGTHCVPAGVSYLGYMVATGWREAILAL